MDLVLRRRGHLPLLLLSLLILSAGLHTRADVITLTAETFSDKVKEKDTVWFVKFCVPWCKYCKNLGTLWEDLGKAVEGEDEIEIGQVDCSISKPVCSKVDIHSYPTFKIFYDGEEFAKYKAIKYLCLAPSSEEWKQQLERDSMEGNCPRDVDSLKMFVLDEAEKAARMKLEGVRDSS